MLQMGQTWKEKLLRQGQGVVKPLGRVNEQIPSGTQSLGTFTVPLVQERRRPEAW